jgi:hypothetical protein
MHLFTWNIKHKGSMVPRAFAYLERIAYGACYARTLGLPPSFCESSLSAVRFRRSGREDRHLNLYTGRDIPRRLGGYKR